MTCIKSGSNSGKIPKPPLHQNNAVVNLTVQGGDLWLQGLRYFARAWSGLCQFMEWHPMSGEMVIDTLATLALIVVAVVVAAVVDCADDSPSER